MLFATVAITSCDKDDPIIPDKETPSVGETSDNEEEEEEESNKEVEINLDNLYGEWGIEREDNGLLIKTTLNIDNNGTCTYKQTIEEEGGYYEYVMMHEIALSGNWLFDNKTSLLTLNLSDNDGNETSIIANVACSYGYVHSFNIADNLYEKDFYYFKK